MAGALARLKRDGSGIAAVEFALVLPMLLTMWFGMELYSEYTTADAKVLMSAQSVANLIAQLSTNDANTFANIAQAATQTMSPLSTTKDLTVDAVGVTYASGTNAPSAGWECTTANGGPAADSPPLVTLASNLGSSTQMTVMVTVKYAFAPSMSFNFLNSAIRAALGKQTLVERAFSRPRLVSQLAKPC